MHRHDRFFCEKNKTEKDVGDCIDDYLEANIHAKELTKNKNCRNCKQGGRIRQEFADT